MARRKTIAQLIDELEPSIRRAFLESVATVKSDVQIRLIVRALEQGNTARALSILEMDRGYFTPLDRALTDAYARGGDLALSGWKAQALQKGVQVRGSFDLRNPRAERWLSEQSSQLITNINEESREAVRTLLQSNMEVGTAPRTTALDMVGRVNKVTGKREGGIIGLTDRDVKARIRAIEELKADPTTRAGQSQLRNYLGRKTRDKRFDGTVRKAIKDGKRIPADRIRRMATGMENKMLRNRGEAIARTELLQSVHQSQDEAIQQMIDRGDVGAQNVIATWDTATDGFERDSHAFMDGQVRRQGEPFETGNGYLMMRPGDSSLGAPAEEVINCRCAKRVSVNWIAEGAEQERRNAA